MDTGTHSSPAHWWNICINVFFPLLLYRWRIYRERRHLKKQLRSLELEEMEEFGYNHHSNIPTEERLEKKKQLLNKRILLEHAQVDLWEEIMLPEHDSFTEYLFAVTQFAYVCCFSVVLPITPVIVLINHLVNMRLDAFKLCRGRRRPLAVQTGGIGVWNHVLHIVTVIAILTNCALMALTTSQFSWLGDKLGKLGVFAISIGVEHFLLLVKYIMQLTASRLPSSVDIEIKKKKYDQERKRYKSLRMKKRSKSSFGSKNLVNDKQNANPDDSGITLKMSPCPPIRESSTDNLEQKESVVKSDPILAAQNMPRPEKERNGNAPVLSSSKRAGLVNVRALSHHSPQQDDLLLQNLQANTRRNKYSREATKPSNHCENEDPNTNKNPEFTNAFNNSQFNLLLTGSKNIDTNAMNTSGKENTQLSKLHFDASSSTDTRSSKLWRPSENSSFSPDSSISTLPTPCHLRLESPRVEHADEFEVPVRGSSSIYQFASAPPMSPEDGIETIDLTDESSDAPKAKWAVYHSFQYNKSAQKEMRSKKSR